MSPTRKGLWFSVLLRPRLQPQETTQLTVVSATALRRAIRNVTGLAAEIKWPNDLLLGGKKTAGILTELSAELDRVRHVILGIGVDVNLDAAGFPPGWRWKSCANWIWIMPGCWRANSRRLPMNGRPPA